MTAEERAQLAAIYCLAVAKNPHAPPLEKATARILKETQDAQREAYEECARLAEQVECPHLLTPGQQREKFYQKHIKSAWRQAGHHLARKFRALSEGGEE